MDFLRATLSLRCDVGRDGDGDRLEDEVDEGERALVFVFTGFLVIFGDAFIDDDDDDDDDRDGERFFVASFLRGFIGLRLCCGDFDGERR